MKLQTTLILLLTAVLCPALVNAQEASEGVAPVAGQPVDSGPAVDPGAADSTVVYEADFFEQYNPITASDMLGRIPGGNVFGGGNRGGGGRGLGTGKARAHKTGINKTLTIQLDPYQDDMKTRENDFTDEMDEHPSARKHS